MVFMSHHFLYYFSEPILDVKIAFCQVCVPYRLPERSTAESSAPPALDRAKGLGGRGVQGFRRGGAVGAPGPGTGAAWGSPRAAAVSDRGLARLSYRRAPLMAPVFSPLAEAPGRETSPLRCWTCREVGHLARDCPVRECGLSRPDLDPEKLDGNVGPLRMRAGNGRSPRGFRWGRLVKSRGGGCGASTGVWLGCLRSGPTRPRAGSHGS
ncbi:UNVERIFIED_CONTAM: hypothetical protein FKN15_046802 [Acipenser sinensis]